MTDQPSRAGSIVALGAVGAVVCCGLPWVLAAGAGVTVAGVGLRSGLLIVAGAIAVVAAVRVRRDRRRAACSDADEPADG